MEECELSKRTFNNNFLDKRETLTEQVLQMYAEMQKPVDIGKALGINAATVRKILHENDVRIRSSSEYPK